MYRCLLVMTMLLLLSCHSSTSDRETSSNQIAQADEKDGQIKQTFSKSIRFNDKTVLVSVFGEGSIRTLRLEWSDSSRMEREVEGIVADAYFNDLDQNGSPELYIMVNSAGSGGYGDVIGYLYSKDSLSEIKFPSPEPDNSLFNGYMGHDSIFISNNQLLRKFPVYRQGDPNSAPSGGERTLLYTLKCIEAGCGFSITALPKKGVD